MQWAFTLEGEPASSSIFVEVPDGVTPPNVGEKICANGNPISGVFFVKSREFMASFPDSHAGKLTFGWAFTITKSE